MQSSLSSSQPTGDDAKREAREESRLKSWAGRASLLAFGPHALALLDQGVVSAANFITTIVVARSAGPSGLGLYAIAFSIVVTLLALQEALIVAPYAIRLHSAHGAPAQHAGAALWLSCALSAVVAAGLVFFALGAAAFGADGPKLSLLWTLAGVAPVVMGREFFRRHALAHLNMRRTLLLDAAASGMQLCGLAALAALGAVSAATALAALGLAAGLTVAGGAILTRREFSFSRDVATVTARHFWVLGRWLLVSRGAMQAQSYLPYWMAGVYGGPAATGVIAACMSVVALANPVVFGITNVLTPRAALAWRQGGGAGLRRQTVQEAAIMAAALALLLLTIVIGGDRLLHFLYGSQEFASSSRVLSVFALALASLAIGIPAANALAAMERPRAIVVVTALTLPVTAVAIGLLMARWGTLGAACGYLFGTTFGTIGRWLALFSLTKRKDDESAALAALAGFLGRAPEGAVLRRVGEGDHAVVYTTACSDHQVAIKVFKADVGFDFTHVRAQFDALSKFHQAVNGRRFSGWEIFVPKPLAVSADPLAIVMSAAPGEDFDSCLATATPPEFESVENAAAAFAGALLWAWARGGYHGDLGFQNLLFDFENRILSFIDPGTHEACRECSRGVWPPAVRDLAHLLAHLTSDMMEFGDRAAARAYRPLFAEAVLSAQTARFPTLERKSRFLVDVRDCARAHFDEILQPGWSPRGLWHVLVRRRAERGVAVLLKRIASDYAAAPDDVSLAYRRVNGTTSRWP